MAELFKVYLPVRGPYSRHKTNGYDFSAGCLSQIMFISFWGT